MSAIYREDLESMPGAEMHVGFVTDRRDVADYSVALLLAIGDRLETIRVYDGSHGINDLHRYTRSDGKQAATVFHHGTLGEGMRAAIDQMKGSCVSMIEGWDGR